MLNTSRPQDDGHRYRYVTCDACEVSHTYWALTDNAARSDATLHGWHRSPIGRQHDDPDLCPDCVEECRTVIARIVGDSPDYDRLRYRWALEMADALAGDPLIDCEPATLAAAFHLWDCDRRRSLFADLDRIAGPCKGGRVMLDLNDDRLLQLEDSAAEAANNYPLHTKHDALDLFQQTTTAAASTSSTMWNVWRSHPDNIGTTTGEKGAWADAYRRQLSMRAQNVLLDRHDLDPHQIVVHGPNSQAGLASFTGGF